MKFKVTWKNKFGWNDTKVVESESPEEVQKKVFLAPGEEIISVEEVIERDPTKFDFSILSKSARESDGYMNDENMSPPAHVTQPPMPASIEVDAQFAVGAIVEFKNEKRLCTSSEYISQADAADAEDGFDVFIDAGWHSTLVRLDADVMTVLSERFRAGEVEFGPSGMVRFSNDMRGSYLVDLAYSTEIGLYDKTRIQL